MSLLRVSGLKARLGRRQVLKGVCLNVGAGEFVGLIGPNGAGKTTLLRAALGLTPSEGAIEFSGKAFSTLNGAARARHVAYLPQEREIAWPVPVRRVVELGRAPHLSLFARHGRQDDEAVARAMRRIGIDGFAERPATALSGGEKARVLIARALAQEAPLLLADEPTAGLDPEHQIALMRIFSGLAREGGGIVACLHDLGLAARWCSRLVLLADGIVVADGKPRDVLTAKRLRDVYNVKAYLGESDGGLIVHPLDSANDEDDAGSSTEPS